MEYKDILKNEMGDYYDEKLIENLENMGFFEAPASTKFHGNYRGGLFQHSLEVMRQLVCLTKNNALSWEDPRSPYIVGLLHDLCKYDQYSVRLQYWLIFKKKNILLWQEKPGISKVRNGCTSRCLILPFID